MDMTPAEQLAAMPKPPPEPITHDITIVTTRKLASAKVLGVPPEEFGIERNARDIKTCNYCYHEVVTKTETQLIDEGFDAEQIRALNDYTGTSDNETISRDSVQEHTGAGNINAAARLVKITEHYVRMDYEGKGRACLYMVITGGDQGEILKKDGKVCIEPIDVIPFACTTPVPITHRFFGRSIADLVVDIQKIKTSLLRSGLDSKYLSSGADVEIAESHVGASTIDDLLGPKRPGRIIRTKQPGGLNYQVVPDTSEASFAAMGYMDSLLEMRTGVSRQGQGVDANALQNQSATAVAQVFSASQARMKLIARIMAEGVRDIFSLLHHTIRSHGQEQQTVRLRNKWVEVDPRNWKTRNDMTINVGLGNGGKGEQFAQIMALANVQKEMIAGGKTNLVGDQELYNTGSEIARIMGHKNANKFFNDPSEKNPDGSPKYPPPPPPTPESVQVAQLKAQSDQQKLGVQAQLDQQADERKAQIEATQAQADIATQDRKTQAEMIQSEREFELKRELAILEFQLQERIAEREEARKEREHQQQMAQSAEQHRQQMEAGVFKVAQGAEAHDQKMEQMKSAPKPKGGK